MDPRLLYSQLPGQLAEASGVPFTTDDSGFYLVSSELDLLNVYHKATLLTDMAHVDVIEQVKFAISSTDFCALSLSGIGPVKAKLSVCADERYLLTRIIPVEDLGQTHHDRFRASFLSLKSQLLARLLINDVVLVDSPDGGIEEIKVIKFLSGHEPENALPKLGDTECSFLPPAFQVIRRQGIMLIEILQEHRQKQQEIGRMLSQINHLDKELNQNLEKLDHSRKKANALAKKNQDLDRFSYMVTHDLKAPVRAVNTLVDFLMHDLGENVKPEVKEQLFMIKGRMKSMHDFIQNVLEYSKLGKIEFNKESFFIHDCVAEIVASIDVPASTRILYHQLPRVTCEKLLLKQVLQNLIDNALKYSDKPDGIVEITCEDAEEDGMIKILVKDNGKGIKKHQLRKIFELFHTSNCADKYGSTGIGLHIVKKIVEEKGGKVNVETEPGKGSIFTFTWPR